MEIKTDDLFDSEFAIRLIWMGKKEFAILLAADCKSADPKEVRSFFDDGFQIRRSA